MLRTDQVVQECITLSVLIEPGTRGVQDWQVLPIISQIAASLRHT